MSDVYIAGAIRTPIGKFGGSLSHLSAVDLGVIAAEAAMANAGIAAENVAETLFGHGRQAGCGPNPARQIAVRAGVPQSSPAMTVNQACASGMRAITLAHQSIQSGIGDVYLAGGTESMSNTPYLLPRARWGYRLGNGELVDAMYRDGFQCPVAEQLMGRTAENLVEEYGISRAEQDRYALESQRRAYAARDALAQEMIPITLRDRKGNTSEFRIDEHVRSDASPDGMAKLKPVFKENGTVHAGNASGITDGAAACVVFSAEAAKRYGVTPMARIVAHANVGVDARRMGMGPVAAVQKLLADTKMTLSDIDLIEINEAFAAQVLACQRELNFDMGNTNVNGGAIALGHPIGCSGARIVVTLLHEMQRRNSHYGIATLCVSGGMGMAMLLERV